MSANHVVGFDRGRRLTGKAMTAASLVRHSRERQAKWKWENAEAIAKYNDLIATRGIFSEGQRRFGFDEGDCARRLQTTPR